MIEKIIHKKKLLALIVRGKYRNKKGSYKGTPFNTAGWTSVEIAGKIIEKIGPILATKY